MEKYNLFIGRYKELPEEKYTYYTPNSGYMLVFTDNPLLDSSFKKVLPEKIENLKIEERMWLSSTKLVIAGNMCAVNCQEVARSMNKFLDVFEENLKSYKNKIEEKKD